MLEQIKQGTRSVRACHICYNGIQEKQKKKALQNMEGATIKCGSGLLWAQLFLQP